MKTNLKWMMALALLGACGREDSGPAAAQKQQATVMELCLRGDNLAAFRSVLVDVRELSVTADGQPVKLVKPTQMHIDLANGDHAWLLGAVSVPVTASKVHVSLRLDDFGGFDTATAGGVIDARGKPISFDVPVGKQATVVLDLARSLVAARTADTRYLLPRITVTN